MYSQQVGALKVFYLIGEFIGCDKLVRVILKLSMGRMFVAIDCRFLQGTVPVINNFGIIH